jgi:TonB family protein
VTLLIGLAIRSSLVLAGGLLLAACLNKQSAALRHRVLAASLLAAALVTPFSLVLPAWNVTLPADASPASSSSLLPAGIRSVEPAARQPQASSAASERSAASASMEVVVLAGWLTGVVAVGGMLAAGLVSVRRLSARAASVDDPRWLQMRDRIAQRYGLDREIRIVRTDVGDLLATWGVLRPQVLVPRDAGEWPDARVQVVLCHELAHIRRHDWIVQMGAEALRAVLWFNPLAWIACRRLRRESEQACDDHVLNMGIVGRDYAAHLLALARQCRRPRTWATALPMAHPSTLERRIVAMLNPRLDRRAPSRRVVATLGGLLLLVTLPLASLRAGQAGPAPLAGTIYDASGGVLPGVTVSLVDATQASATAISNASGRFEFPAVHPGTYVMEAGLPGFRTLRHEFALSDAADWNRAVTLQVGQLQETVVVSANRSAGGAAAAASGPIRVGGNIRPPRKVTHVNPVYPASMQDAGLSGVVPLEAIIDRDGVVSSVRVLSAQAHPDLAAAAVDAVRQWRFTPTLLNGQPVEVAMTVSVRFDLE